MISTTDYYPFGSTLPGRSFSPTEYAYSMNGQEKDDEISGVVGAHTTAEFWEYDTRLGRRWNLDPKPNPSISFYAAFSNNPIMFSDPLGDTITDPNGNLQNEGHGYTQSDDGQTLSGDGLKTKVWDPDADVGTGQPGGYVDKTDVSNNSNSSNGNRGETNYRKQVAKLLRTLPFIPQLPPLLPIPNPFLGADGIVADAGVTLPFAESDHGGVFILSGPDAG